MKELRERANKHLSNYVGDDLVSFSGNAGQQYTMKMANAAVDSKVIAIFPGWTGTKAELEALTGKTIDGLITETIADVTKSGQPKPLDAFVEFCKRNPVNVKKIHMTATDSLQFENSLEVLEGLNPFGDPASRYITPSSHKNPDQNNDKLVHIEGEKLQFNDQTAVIVELNAGVTATMVFFIDAIYNGAKVLDRSVEQSHSARHYSGD